MGMQRLGLQQWTKRRRPEIQQPEIQRPEIQQGRQKNAENGFALIWVVCLMALVTALSLSLLYSAAQISGGAAQKPLRENCYQQALTLSYALQNKLEGKKDAQGKLTDTGFRDFVSSFIDSTDPVTGEPSYQDDYPLTSEKMTPGREEFGEFSVELTKVPAEGNTDDGTGTWESVYVNDYDVTVGVRVTLDDITCTVRSEYQRLVEYQAKYYADEEGEEELAVGEDGCFYRADGTLFRFDDDTVPTLEMAVSRQGDFGDGRKVYRRRTGNVAVDEENRKLITYLLEGRE